MPREDLPFCECRWLERAALDPECPIVFDAELREYALRFQGNVMSIYHCPFCAGRAPESLRPRTFTTIPPPEVIRLHQLTGHLKDESEVLAALGEPTHVFNPGVASTSAEKEGEPRETHAQKNLRYEQHSETAVISVNVSRYGKIRISFVEKSIGKAALSEKPAD